MALMARIDSKTYPHAISSPDHLETRMKLQCGSLRRHYPQLPADTSFAGIGHTEPKLDHNDSNVHK